MLEIGTEKSITGAVNTISADSKEGEFYVGDKVLQQVGIVSEAAGIPNKNQMYNIAIINARRLEFIDTLSQEFFLVKGYGVYAYLSTIDVIRLFERFLARGLSAKAFAKEYVRSF